MKILSIVGARPQFVKAAVVSRALKRQGMIRERILHTGQHFDQEMSEIFFRQLGIPKPYKNLGIHGGSHSQMASKMLVAIEQEMLRTKPDLVLVYGDTNSTLAGALAAAKLLLPIGHVEAGLRSFNRAMPEETNRIVADTIADILFAPTPEGVLNLEREGAHGRICRVGDVMIDAIYLFRDRSRTLPAKKVDALIPKDPYFALTLHRQENTDSPKRLRSILKGLATSSTPFVFPAHPRTRKAIARHKLRLPKNIQMIPPVSYLEMILLQDRSKAVWTDSGGVQKEAVVLGKHCYTLRDETEWVETVKHGWNHLLGADTQKIQKALRTSGREKKRTPFPVKKYYGDGKAAEKIARIISKLTL